MEREKKQLDEIVIMRPILICIFLVGYHAFAPWSGAWPMPKSIQDESVIAYFWLDKFLYSFMLEAFVFISGYLFAYQIYYLNKSFTLKSLCWNKFKRLIIPCVVFSVSYSFISYKSDFGVWEYIYDILCGLGHLWFLPMLFWCFVTTYLLEKVKINYSSKLMLLFILSIISNGYGSALPLRLALVGYYIFFFYLAFGIFNHRVAIIKRFAITNRLWAIISAYIFTFLLFTLYIKNCNETECLKPSYIYRGTKHFASLIYSIFGILSFYLLTTRYLQKGYNPSSAMVWLNPLCMGIFLIHNFIFRFVYDLSGWPAVLGTYILPWVGYVVALVSSLLLSVVLRKTQVGRFLIG